MRLFCLILLGLVLGAAPVQAEFYKYLDKNGNVRFTDDLSEVPPDQRKAEAFEQYSGVKSPSPDPSKTKEAETEGGFYPVAEEMEEEPSTEAESMSGDMIEQRKALEERQESLRQEYEALMKETRQLQNRPIFRSPAEVRAYEEKLKAHEERVKAYNQKKQALDADIEAFNQQVGAQAPSEPQPEE